MAINHSQMHLGKRPRRNDPRTLKLARYLLPGAPGAELTPPASCDYTRGIKNWGMMLNDRLGCCTIAAVGHAVQVWTANASQEVTVPDSAILSYYEQWDGYNPQDPSSDQGGVELDVLNDWRQQGFAGHSLDAYVSIDLQNSDGRANREIGRPGDGANNRQTDHPAPLLTGSPDQPITRSVAPPIPQVALAIWLFGGAYIGVQLPIRAQNQKVWDVPQNPGPDDEPGSWGGHAIFLVGYDFGDSGYGKQDTGDENSETQIPSRGSAPNPVPRVPCPGTLTCITWGQPKKMTWAWFEKYCDEAYAPVSKDWIKAQGVAPSGFDLATLEGDLKLVTA